MTGRGADYPIDVVDGTPGDQGAIYADVGKARKELDWYPKVALEVGLAVMHEWASTTVAPAP